MDPFRFLSLTEVESCLPEYAKEENNYVIWYPEIRDHIQDKFTPITVFSYQSEWRVLREQHFCSYHVQRFQAPSLYVYVYLERKVSADSSYSNTYFCSLCTFHWCSNIFDENNYNNEGIIREVNIFHVMGIIGFFITSIEK